VHFFVLSPPADTVFTHYEEIPPYSGQPRMFGFTMGRTILDLKLGAELFALVWPQI